MRVAATFAASLILVSTGAFALAGDARAQSPATPPAGDVAGQRYDAGSRAFEDHHFVEAALYFEAAAAEHPSAVALFTAALAWEGASALDRAADDYTRALAAADLQPSDQAMAQKRLSVLEPVMGRIEVTAPDGWFVQLDANSEVTAPATLHGTPGMHALGIRAPNRPLERRPVHLAMGESQKIDLKDTPPPSAEKKPVTTIIEHDATPESPPPMGDSPGVAVRKTVGLVTLGFGVATLAAGAVIGFQALDARDAYNAKPTQPGFDHADSMQSWTNIAFIAGGVLTIGGAALAFWPFKSGGGSSSSDAPKDPSVALVPTIGGALLRGSF